MDFAFKSSSDDHDYPSSALALVECSDGRWFIEQEFGDEYSQCDGVPKSRDDEVTEPNFYPNVAAAARAAVALIRQIYPTVSQKKMTDACYISSRKKIPTSLQGRGSVCVNVWNVY
jgi:hypothetical protein